MNNEQQMKQIEMSLEVAKDNIERAAQLARLSKNVDFIALIHEEYFKEEASRAVMLKSEPNIMGKDEQVQVDNIILGIGALRQFFIKCMRMGDMAAKALADDEKTREELMHEQLNENSTGVVM